jgi:hypothetical protein
MLMASWGCIWSPCMRPLGVSTALYYNRLLFTDRAFIWADKLFRNTAFRGSFLIPVHISYPFWQRSSDMDPEVLACLPIVLATSSSTPVAILSPSGSHDMFRHLHNRAIWLIYVPWKHAYLFSLTISSRSLRSCSGRSSQVHPYLTAQPPQSPGHDCRTTQLRVHHRLSSQISSILSNERRLCRLSQYTSS